MGMQRGDQAQGVRGEINVTPLVDVCLVLLIIFMVLIPKHVPELTVTVPPDRDDGPRSPPDRAPLVLGLHKDGGVTLRRQPIARARLSDALRDELARRDRKAVFIDFDEDVAYARAVETLDTARRAGAEVLAIVTPRGRAAPSSLR